MTLGFILFFGIGLKSKRAPIVKNKTVRREIDERKVTELTTEIKK